MRLIEDIRIARSYIADCANRRYLLAWIPEEGWLLRIYEDGDLIDACWIAGGWIEPDWEDLAAAIRLGE